MSVKSLPPAAHMPALVLLVLLLSGAALPPAAHACTSIIVGKKASSDGSVFIARNGKRGWPAGSKALCLQQAAGVMAVDPCIAHMCTGQRHRVRGAVAAGRRGCGMSGSTLQ